MKTLKSLRTEVANNNGKLEIGKLAFRMSASSDGQPGDIDIYLYGRMVAWITADQDDRVPLPDVDMNIMTSNLADRDEIEALRAENARLRAELEDRQSQFEAANTTMRYAENEIASLKADLSELEFYRNLFSRELVIKPNSDTP